MEKRTHAKSKSNDRLAFSKSDIKRLEKEAYKLQKAQEQLGISDAVLKASKEGRPLITKDEVDNMVKNVNEFEEIVDSMEEIKFRAPITNPNKDLEGIQVRDLFDDIPYVDSQQSVKVDELNDWIHIKPKLLRHGERFEHDGQTYYVTKYHDGTFSIHPTID